MLALEANVLTPQQQREMIKETTSQDKLITTIMRLYQDEPSFGYIPNLKGSLPNKRDHYLREDYYRLFGLYVCQFATTAIPSLHGQLGRHAGKKWELPPYDSKHILAMACYGAKASSEAEEFRKMQEEYIRQNYSLEDQEYLPGLWGLHITIVGGNFMAPDTSSRSYYSWDSVVNAMKERFKYKIPICLPDPQLMEGLAQVNYTGFQAEMGNTQHLREEVVPRVQEVVGDLLDVEAAVFNPVVKPEIKPNRSLGTRVREILAGRNLEKSPQPW